MNNPPHNPHQFQRFLTYGRVKIHIFVLFAIYSRGYIINRRQMGFRIKTSHHYLKIFIILVIRVVPNALSMLDLRGISDPVFVGL